ncbi:MAG: cob(I)yrinic acid a,c-diamide adenosyltransferase [Candidatus Jordarchaeales archaeon]|nr:cob(I)yrinic acid a,c-diamide adenosyltransferase [Candidatus Jordarchaeia archaeon]
MPLLRCRHLGKCYIHLYTGDGEGKTLTAIGAAVRALGHGFSVFIVQFMKGRKDVGEYLAMKRFKPMCKVYQFGRREFVDLEKPHPIDYELAREGLSFTRKLLKRKKPDVLILDEINLAVAVGLLRLDDVLMLLEEAKDCLLVVLTGRRAPKELVERADLVTEMREVKHPLKAGIDARRGVDY